MQKLLQLVLMVFLFGFNLSLEANIMFVDNLQQVMYGLKMLPTLTLNLIILILIQ